MTRPPPRRAADHVDTAPEDTSAAAPTHPRLTTEWIRFSPGAGPGISEATIGWVLSARRRLLVEGRWQLLDLFVYETLYTLVQHAVDPELGVVLQWTGTYDDLGEALGGGNTRPSKDGRLLFRPDALRAARDRLERRGLITTRTLREVQTVAGHGTVVRSQGMVWRLVPGGEAAYDERLSRYGADGANDPDRRGAGSPGLTSPTGPERGTASPGATSSTGPVAGPGSPGPTSSTGRGRGTGSPGPTSSTGRERGTGSPGPGADLREQATAVPLDVEPGQPVSSLPLSPPSPEEHGPDRPAPATPGERVAHLLTPDTVRDAVDALVEAGWDGERRGAEVFVEGLQWRSLAVPLLIAQHRERLAGRDEHVVKFVRANLTPGKQFHIDDDELAELILGRGGSAEASAAADVTPVEKEMATDLRAWLLTGEDPGARHDAVTRFGDQLVQLAADRGVEPLALSEADVVALLRGRTQPPPERGAASVPPPPPAPEPPGAAPAGDGDARPPSAAGADGTEREWLLRAGLLVDDPLQPPAVRQAWAATADPDRRRLLVLVALEVLEGGWRDELDRLVTVATSGAAVQVRARTRADLRWRLED